MRDDRGGREPLAPVIPIFGGPVADVPSRASAATRASATTWNDTWAETHDDDDEEPEEREDDYDDCAAIEREIAERNLLRKLRTRSLSIREARAAVAERSLTTGQVDAVIDDFVRRGYLDDKALAEQLVHSGVDRKGQGRQVIAQTLAKRGIARDVADAVIAELPDDDVDRALDFARSKARSMGSLDHDTALRRLAGQLARRGYGGSAAFSAARTALDEIARGPSSRVTFRGS